MPTEHTDHVVNKIRSCVVREKPFVHAIVDGVFRNAIYLQTSIDATRTKFLVTIGAD